MRVLFNGSFLVTVLVFTACFVVAFSGSGQVGALSSSSCSDIGRQSFSGNVKAPADTYSIYVKLGSPGQSASVDVSLQSNGGYAGCTQVGSVDASGDLWVKVGEYVEDGLGSTFNLKSANLEGIASGYRPVVMLVSRTNPVCVPDRECATSVAGQSAFIRPTNISAGSSLEVIYAQSLPTSEIKEVRYYADNEFLYRTNGLEEFNVRIFPYYGSKMIRVIEYNSGQLAVIEQEVPSDRGIDFWTVFFMPLYRHKAIFIILGAIVLLLLVRAIIRSYGKRQEWRLHHGLIHKKRSELLFEKYPKLYMLNSAARRIFSKTAPFLAAGMAVIVLGLGVSSYVFQLVKVEGDSMNMSFHSGQTVIVEKIPVTVAQLNQSRFVPKRGQVVVVYPNFSAGSQFSGSEKTIIKRVIGLPGDRVVIDEGRVTVFNDQSPEGFSPQLGTEWSKNVISDSTLNRLEVHLNEDQLFIVGDNRPDSVDSRHSGPIRTNQIIGIVPEL